MGTDPNPLRLVILAFDRHRGEANRRRPMGNDGDSTQVMTYAGWALRELIQNHAEDR